MSFVAKLQCARDCYTRFGMTAQAARVAKVLLRELPIGHREPRL